MPKKLNFEKRASSRQLEVIHLKNEKIRVRECF
jgi:hypothetical protein